MFGKLYGKLEGAKGYRRSSSSKVESEKVCGLKQNAVGAADVNRI